MGNEPASTLQLAGHVANLALSIAKNRSSQRYQRQAARPHPLHAAVSSLVGTMVSTGTDWLRATNGPSFFARLCESVQQDEILLSAFGGLSKLDKANLLLSADPSVRILSKKVGPKGEEATF